MTGLGATDALVALLNQGLFTLFFKMRADQKGHARGAKRRRDLPPGKATQ